MPSNVIKSFAEKSGKSEKEVEALWDEAKEQVNENYTDVEKNSDRYYALVTGILKKMVGLKETFIDLVDDEMLKLNEMEDKEMKKDEEDKEVEEECDCKDKENCKCKGKKAKKKDLEKDEEDEEVEDEDEK